MRLSWLVLRANAKQGNKLGIGYLLFTFISPFLPFSLLFLPYPCYPPFPFGGGRKEYIVYTLLVQKMFAQKDVQYA